MLDKQTIFYLGLFHGFYNSWVMILFIYQGLLGLRIRKQRKLSVPIFNIIKRHRKLGPILTFESMIGFLFGALIVFLDYGHIFKYPLHFITGLLIVLSAIATFLPQSQGKFHRFGPLKFHS